MAQEVKDHNSTLKSKQEEKKKGKKGVISASTADEITSASEA
jgi:hypothetical protein